MFVCNLTHRLNPRGIQVGKKLTEIKSVALDGSLTPAEICKMGDEFFHLLPNSTIQNMINRSKATFADASEQQHIVQHLHAACFLALLRTYGAIEMTGGDKISSDIGRVGLDVKLRHVTDDTSTPQTLVLVDSVPCVTVFLEVLDTSIDEVLNIYFLHNDYIKLGHMPFTYNIIL